MALDQRPITRPRPLPARGGASAADRLGLQPHYLKTGALPADRVDIMARPEGRRHPDDGLGQSSPASTEPDLRV